MSDDDTEAEFFRRLMDGKTAQMVITDPPYNVPIDGHVCGLGRIRHGEFMSPVTLTSYSMVPKHDLCSVRSSPVSYGTSRSGQPFDIKSRS